jgi:2-oxoglutarate dehydrogenase E1 component
VNADDPAACLEAARLSWEYRMRFRRDFLIDLVGYRRYGHNEGDEPAFTQPEMYQKIASHPTVRELFARMLVAHGMVPEGAVVGMEKKHFLALETAYASLKPEEDFVAPLPQQSTVPSVRSPQV